MNGVKYYYLISPLAAGGSRRTVFTYHSERPLETGSIVQAELNKRQSFGVVLERVPKPAFPTKLATPIPLLPLPPQTVELARWLSRYYATPLAKVWQSVLPGSPYVSKPRKTETKQPKAARAKPITLTAHQQQAVEAIGNGPIGSYLLYGATGSGKTQVYIELIKQAMAKGKSAIVLVPEISLTPQITQSFAQEFGGNIILTHSAMTLAERRLAWQAALNTTSPQVIIGPRSALFLPLPNLGLVVIDEAHDSSYKQDQAPRYYAPAVAAKLAQLVEGKLVLGTATPSINTMWLAQAGKIQLIEMPEPIYKSVRTKPQIIDLKDKSQLSTNYLLSKPLLDMLAETLNRQKQSILFLNRRGSARMLLCRQCGYVAKCPNCQIPLTWHADQGKLLCHWCGYSSAPPAACPDCGNLNLRFMGSGTERLESELKQLFPTARLARLDKDSFDKRTLGKLYDQLQNNQIDILLGTQMITKGLDLPGVESVGIVLADTMLYLPDFSAAERTFQLLYQVSGRAGRRDQAIANLVVQTYSPTHPVIQAAASGDYAGFIENEWAERKLLKYPPFAFLLKLETSRATRETAQAEAAKLANSLAKINEVEVVGPAPAWHETLGGNFHWQIIVKSKRRQPLVKIAQDLPTGWVHDLDPIDLL